MPFFEGKVDKPGEVRYNVMVKIEAWLSLVERLVRDQEAVGSNPVASTKIGNPFTKVGGFLILYYSFFVIKYSSFIKTDFRNE